MRAFNIKLEEGVAVLAAYADQGIKGQEAGTMLGRVLRLLVPAAVENEKAYDDLGIKVFNTSGNLRHMADITEDLENALGGMNVETRAAALETLGFQKKMQATIFPLLGASERIREYNERLDEAGGISREVAENQLSSLSAQFRLIMNNVNESAASLLNFQDKSNVLINVLKRVNDLLKGVSNMNTANKIAVVRITAFSAGALVLIPALIKIVTFTKAAAVVTFTLNKALLINTAVRIANIKQIWATVTAMAVNTGATKAQVVSTLLMTKVTIGATAALGAFKLAAMGAGIAVAAAATAFIGWKIGRKISEVTGLNKKLTEFYGTVIFGTDILEKESKTLDASLIIVKKRRVLIRQLININKAAALSNRDLTISETKQQTKLISGIRKIGEQLGVSAESIERTIKLAKSAKFELPPPPPSAKELAIESPAAKKAREELMKKVADFNFSQLTDAKKLNSLLERRKVLQAEVAKFIGLKKVEAETRQLEINKKIISLEKNKNETLKSLRERLESIQEKRQLATMKRGEKLNFLLEKRKKLLEELKEAVTRKAKLEIAIKFEKLEAEIKSVRDTKADVRMETSVTSAVLKGTAEALRAENIRVTKEGKIVENTKRTANGVDKMNKTLTNISTKLVAGAGGSMQLQDVFA